MEKINGLNKEQLKTPSAAQLYEFLNGLLVKSWTAEAPQMAPESKTLNNQAAVISKAPELQNLNFYEIRELWKRAGARIYETQITGKNFRSYFVPIPGLQGLIFEAKSKGFKVFKKDLYLKANPKEVEAPQPAAEEVEPEELSLIRRRVQSLKTALIPGFGSRSKAEEIRIDILEKCEIAAADSVSRETLQEIFKNLGFDLSEIELKLPEVSK